VDEAGERVEGFGRRQDGAGLALVEAGEGTGFFGGGDGQVHAVGQVIMSK
jgi:hypothetical protein